MRIIVEMSAVVLLKSDSTGFPQNGIGCLKRAGRFYFFTWTGRLAWQGIKSGTQKNLRETSVQPLI